MKCSVNFIVKFRDFHCTFCSTHIIVKSNRKHGHFGQSLFNAFQVLINRTDHALNKQQPQFFGGNAVQPVCIFHILPMITKVSSCFVFCIFVFFVFFFFSNAPCFPQHFPSRKTQIIIQQLN